MRAVSKSGEKILRGARKVLSYAQGEARARRVHSVAVPERIDVAAIRTRLNLSQQQFADRFGFSVANIRNWEQGFRRPEGPARTLLFVIDRNPKAVVQSLSERD
jgi:putative transcriptional regulator